ncbi:hypothetical protein GCM10009863_39480 [Streptomyces axinellae]|uniref:Uncharacterized protein n=2 Tax=Streptomyces axinellae TaxID=552788 RepID=A0ABP6CMD0_9ACTN
MVQEAWLRLSRQDTDTIDTLGGRLTTGVGRISLDVLRSGRTRPEVSLDDQLPRVHRDARRTLPLRKSSWHSGTASASRS